jgi:DNA-directed RNA polymerase specialized sigma subunit
MDNPEINPSLYALAEVAIAIDSMSPLQRAELSAIYERLLAKRDDLILICYDAEIPVPVIAHTCGISKQRVYQIIKAYILSRQPPTT